MRHKHLKKVISVCISVRMWQVIQQEKWRHRHRPQTWLYLYVDFVPLVINALVTGVMTSEVPLASSTEAAVNICYNVFESTVLGFH